jgi:hypothetical protein
MSPDGKLPESLNADHPWFIGVQFHPIEIKTLRTASTVCRLVRAAVDSSRFGIESNLRASIRLDPGVTIKLPVHAGTNAHTLRY